MRAVHEHGPCRTGLDEMNATDAFVAFVQELQLVDKSLCREFPRCDNEKKIQKKSQLSSLPSGVGSEARKSRVRIVSE